ncbi:hypothetical protein NPIL_32091 [Nephila pilipes]|uniref:Uncharacterized protein n=1 Tax=Nephila pilipes TaxID=299642 RepID=A0A8X6TEQ7_NEPPI|nr:hypothetical protein NPIL_32091 [Nephila pilipes]
MMEKRKTGSTIVHLSKDLFQVSFTGRKIAKSICNYYFYSTPKITLSNLCTTVNRFILALSLPKDEPLQ